MPEGNQLSLYMIAFEPREIARAHYHGPGQRIFGLATVRQVDRAEIAMFILGLLLVTLLVFMTQGSGSILLGEAEM